MSDSSLKEGLGDIQTIRQLYQDGFLLEVESIAKRLTAPFYWYAPERPLGSRTLGAERCASSIRVIDYLG